MTNISYFCLVLFVGVVFRDEEPEKWLNSKLGSSVGHSARWLESKGDFLVPESKSSLNS